MTPLRAQTSPDNRAQQSCSQDPPTHSTARAQASHFPGAGRKGPQPGNWGPGCQEVRFPEQHGGSWMGAHVQGLCHEDPTISSVTPEGVHGVFSRCFTYWCCVCDLCLCCGCHDVQVSFNHNDKQQIPLLSQACSGDGGSGEGWPGLDAAPRPPPPPPTPGIKDECGETSFGAQCPVLCREKGQNARMELPTFSCHTPPAPSSCTHKVLKSCGTRISFFLSPKCSVVHHRWTELGGRRVGGVCQLRKPGQLSLHACVGRGLGS